MPSPRSLRDPSAVAHRLGMLDTVDRVQPFGPWSAALTARRPAAIVPHFDPADGGAEARVLVLYEAPGPMTNADNVRPGSGFVYIDNDDRTAETSWLARDAAGLDNGALVWNIVPWYLGAASVKPTADEVTQGALALRTLLPILTELRAVVLSGRFAQVGWKKHIAPHLGDRYAMFETWHPSPLAMNQPGKRDHYFEAIRRAAAYV